MDKDLTDVQYPEPVAQLLTLGDLSGIGNSWRDYPALGLDAGHVPDLIRMATDEALHTADSDSAEVWAPVHAWRALGQLRAEAAIEPLMGLFRLADDLQDDWVSGDLPKVMGLIGPVAIPALDAYMRDAVHGLWARIAASECLVKIGQGHPGARDACVAALTGQLEHFAENGEDLNAFLIVDLVDLRAVESAPVMEQAFAADAVDLSVQGDWEEVQIELGLLTERITPPPARGWLMPKILGTDVNRGKTPPPPPGGKSREKAKKKKKEEKRSRKKNRRK
jgi:hypothetical protein